MTRRLLALLAAFVATTAASSLLAWQKPRIPAPPARRLVVAFFHREVRCAECLRLEGLGQRALLTGFPAEVGAGKVVWRALNLDAAANNKYKREYKLLKSGIVLEELSGAKRVRWSRLDSLWDVLADERAFTAEFGRCIRDFRAGGKVTH